MSVCVVPCLPVERAHLAEARRALAGQAWGRGLTRAAGRAGVPGVGGARGRESWSDAQLVTLLWWSRALPAVLEVLADVADLRDLQLVSPGLALGDVPVGKPLSLVAWRDPGHTEGLVEVLILPDSALATRSWDQVAVHLWVRYARQNGLPHQAPIADDTLEDGHTVRIQRFTAQRAT